MLWLHLNQISQMENHTDVPGCIFNWKFSGLPKHKQQITNIQYNKFRCCSNIDVFFPSRPKPGSCDIHPGKQETTKKSMKSFRCFQTYKSTKFLTKKLNNQALARYKFNSLYSVMSRALWFAVFGNTENRSGWYACPIPSPVG